MEYNFVEKSRMVVNEKEGRKEGRKEERKAKERKERIERDQYPSLTYYLLCKEVYPKAHPI